jgi:hypothetical protein
MTAGWKPETLSEIAGKRRLSCGFVPSRSDSVPFVTCGFVSGLDGVKSTHEASQPFDRGLAPIDVTFAGSTATSLNAPGRKATGAVTDPLSIFAGKPRRQQRSRQSPYPG